MPDDDDEQDPNETTPFIPGYASTSEPGEEIPMQTMRHKQSGLPELSYDETSFGGKNASVEEIERRLNTLRNPTTGLLDTKSVGLHEQLSAKKINKKKSKG